MVRTIDKASISISLEEFADCSGHKVLMEVVDISVPIVGDP
jgi:hypothetical protein